MSLFFVTFFTLYAGMHLYAFLKTRSAFSPGVGVRLFMAVFMLTMTFAPVIIRMTEKGGFDTLARLMSYTGYSWMGLVFLFFTFSLAIDIYKLLFYACGDVLQRNFSYLMPSAKLSFFIPVTIAMSISILGYFEAKDIRTEKITIKTSKIPREAGRLRIAQISDVHTGLIVREDRLERIINAVKMAQPDILVSTGDLVDGQMDNLSSLPQLFREINPVYGKYAITGNHEFYAGVEQAIDFTKKAGFTVLRGEGVTVNGNVNIAGVDDPAGKQYGLYKDVSEKDLLSRLPADKFTLLLKHRPYVDKDASGLFDLQLSGHTHKGQIFPFNLITKMRYPVHAGFLKLNQRASIYVSRGSGTWGPPVRFLSPPEVTIIELIPDNSF